jgi:hypothetical protein
MEAAIYRGFAKKKRQGKLPCRSGGGKTAPTALIYPIIHIGILGNIPDTKHSVKGILDFFIFFDEKTARRGKTHFTLNTCIV